MKKRIISLCMVFTLIFAMLPHITLSVDAAEVIESGTCGDNLTWVLDSEGTLTVSGTGSMDEYFSDCPWEDVRNKIVKIVVNEGVTTIGSCAFEMCYYVTGISLPDSLKSIGMNAFSHCYRLKEINIPKGVTEIGVGEGSSTTGGDPFFACSTLQNISVAKDNPNYYSEDGVLFNKDKTKLIVCPDGKSGQFVIPYGVITIGNNAFYGCTNLTGITIPDSVAMIEWDAFGHCDLITTIVIPNSVSTIEESAFLGCDILEKVSIPASVNSIGGGVFYGCDAMIDITVDDANPNYSSKDGVLFDKSKIKLIAFPKGKTGIYEIPDSVTIIGEDSFEYCANLTALIIPTSIGIIEDYAFYRCDALSDVYYPGNEEEWQNINIGDQNECLSDAVIHYNYRTYSASFTSDQDGWSFANATQSFAEEPASHADDYFIPRERYDDLFGSSYVDATEGLYTEEWGGNCAGMSATAILFFLDSLDWESIDAAYTEDFTNPNDFYRTVNLDQKSQSYYPAIGNDTEVTRLIEAYQLYINAIDKSRLTENLDNTYFAADVTEKKTLFGTEYIINHVPNGTYIASMLEEFQEAYEENNPLFIVLQADGFGHGIVARTDLKPEDMGDGWWRVYVYDPNKPYINESVCSVVSGVEAEPIYTFGCNELIDNGGDTYLELNPSLNQWRYCTSVNSNNADKYIGSSPSGDLLWKKYYHDATPENENDDEGKKNNAKIPDYFYTIDLTDLSMEDFANPHFDGINAWIPENNLAIAVDDNTDCSIYASTGELVAIVEDGDAFVLTDSGSYDAYIGQTGDGGSTGGRIYLPNDVYTVYYTSGIIQFLGNDNALSFSFEGAAELTVDIAINSLQILAQEDGIAAVKCANVTATDECAYVDTEGALIAGESFTIAYSDENKVEASTDSKDGEFQLYQKDTDQDEPAATKVVKSSSLWWLWIVGGVVVAGIVLVILLKKKKPNA